MPKKEFIPKILSISLPFPPSVNQAYRQWQGRLLISEAGRKYQKSVNFIWLAMKQDKRAVEFGKDRLRVTIFAYPPDKRRRDLDNLGKLLLDGLEKVGAYENDSQIDNLTYVRCWIEKPGRVEVFLRNIKPENLMNDPAASGRGIRRKLSFKPRGKPRGIKPTGGIKNETL